MIREVPRLHEPLTPALLGGLEDEGLPIVLVGAARDWPAAAWGVDELRARLGQAPVGWKRSPSHRHPDFHAPSLQVAFAREAGTLGELLDHLTLGPVEERAGRVFTGDEQFALRRRNGLTEVCPALVPLLEAVPLAEVLPADRLYTMWAWLSGAGARTWLHYDNNGCHNLNAQLRGRKSCVLFAPEALPRLAPFPIGGANPAVNCCAVDVEAPGALAGVEGFGAELEAGDVLFLPAWWIHSFAHHGELNLNVNGWWKPLREATHVVARRQALADEAGRARPRPGSPEALSFVERDAAVLRGGASG